MRYRLRGISTYGLDGLRKEDEHTAYTLVGVRHPIPCASVVGASGVAGSPFTD